MFNSKMLENNGAYRLYQEAQGGKRQISYVPQEYNPYFYVMIRLTRLDYSWRNSDEYHLPIFLLSGITSLLCDLGKRSVYDNHIGWKRLIH